MPALPGAQIEPVGQRACRHLPGQRVLAPAGAEEENVHAGQALARPPAACGTRPSTASTPASTPARAAWFAGRMKVLAGVACCCLVLGAAPARPPATTRWRTGPECRLQGRHRSTQRPIRKAAAPPRSGTPTPAGATARRAAPGRWTDCVGSADADACRPHLDACDRSCQRSCRSISAAARCSASSTSDGAAVIAVRAIMRHARTRATVG